MHLVVFSFPSDMFLFLHVNHVSYMSIMYLVYMSHVSFYLSHVSSR